MDVVTINRFFPCCGHLSRFSETDAAHDEVPRRCHRCGTEYIVTRKTINPTRRGETPRIDELEWKEKA